MPQLTSYHEITAVTCSDHGQSFEEIALALHNMETPSLPKLEWQSSTNAIANNHKIAELESQYLTAANALDNLILGMNELKLAPTKQLSQEEYNRHMASIDALSKSCKQLKNQLAGLDDEITYLSDFNQDIQKRYREKFSRDAEKINAVHQEMITAIMPELEKLGFGVDYKTLQKKLSMALRHPAIQAEMIAAAVASTKSSGKSFTDKLKGWFK